MGLDDGPRPTPRRKHQPFGPIAPFLRKQCIDTPEARSPPGTSPHPTAKAEKGRERLEPIATRAKKTPHSGCEAQPPRPPTRVPHLVHVSRTFDHVLPHVFAHTRRFWALRNSAKPRNHPRQNPTPSFPRLPTNVGDPTNSRPQRRIARNRPQLTTDRKETNSITGLFRPQKTSLDPPRQHLRQVHRQGVRILRNLLAATESVADNDRIFPSGAHCRKQHPLP